MGNSFLRSKQLLQKACELTPLGSQTYSKSYRYFCQGVSPAFIEKGKGCYLWDVDGNKYIDFICALGAVLVGYNDERVNRAIIKQLEKGISFSQPSKLSVELAERLTGIIPGAEMVRYLKNGSDATSSAVKLARAYTGKDIIGVCGYHGMQDWYISSTPNNKGVPDKLKEFVFTFNYNDINSIKQFFDKYNGKIAALILEPIQANGPENDFLKKLKEIAHKNSALIIFDEVISGFRYALGGAAQLYDVVPDLTAFGKGLSNGMPLSVVSGKKEILNMVETDNVFISTTFGDEALSLASAIETLNILSEKGTYEKIWGLGNRMLEGMRNIISKYKLNGIIEVSGLAPHGGLSFADSGSLEYTDVQSVYQQKVTEDGFLTIGINNICLSHTEREVDLFLNSSDEGMALVKKAVEKDSTAGILKSKPINPVFKRNKR